MNIIQKIIIIVLVVVVGAGSAFGIMKFSDYALDYSKNSNIADDYAEFKKLNDIMSKSDVQNETNIEISNFALHNNQKFVKLDDFIKLSGVTANDGVLEYEGFKCNPEEAKAILNNEEYYSLDYLTNHLGYTEIEVGTNKVELKRNFELKRIITKNDLDIDDSNIKYKSKIGSLYLYDLETEYDAKVLQEKLQEDGIDNVVDSFVSVSEDEESETLSANTGANSSTDNDIPSFNTWGGDYMNFGEYIQTLSSYEQKKNMAVIIDTGINYNHDLLKNNFNKKYSKTFCAGYQSNDFMDDNGHGTHVAGTVVELTGHFSDVIAVKALNNKGSGQFSMLYTAFEYALELCENDLPISSINLSVGTRMENVGEWTSSVLYDSFSDVIERLKAKNAIVCASAGNDAEDVKHQALATVDDVVIVSSIDSDESLSSFSNRGKYVTFCAPGDYIKSADYRSNNGYCYKSGTSMAAPHMTAVATLLGLICDNYNFDDKINIMKSSVFDLGAVGKDDNFGYGCIDMSKSEDFIAKNIFDKECISVVDNFGNAVLNKTIKVGYVENHEYKEVSYSQLASLDGKNYYGKLKISISSNQDFLEWRGSVDANFSKSTYLGKERSIWFSPAVETKFLFALFNNKFITAQINFIYIDKDEYTGFASFGNQTFLTYVSESGDRIVNKEYVSGFLASEQVINVVYEKTNGLKISFKCENDSIINKISLNKTFTKDNIVEENLTINNGQYNLTLDDICNSIILNVFIFR